MPTDKVSTQDNQDIGDRGSRWKRSWSEITSKTSRLESQGAPPWLEVVTPGHGGAVLQQFPFVRRIIHYSVFPLWSRWRAWSLTSSCASAPPSQSFILSMFHGPLASAKPSLTPQFILAPCGCCSICLFILSSNMKHPPYIVTRHCTRGWWPWLPFSLPDLNKSRFTKNLLHANTRTRVGPRCGAGGEVWSIQSLIGWSR